VILVRCNYCSKHRARSTVHHLGSASLPGQIICDDCLAWHNQAIELLAGNAMPGCQGCGESNEIVYARSGGVEIRLYVVPKDGIYQVLCARCVGPYVSKRSDLYAGTPFGAAIKLNA
jgi:hypothetical protein